MNSSKYNANVLKVINNNHYFFDRYGNFMHHEMAEFLIRKLNIISLDGQIYFYDGKKYINNEDKLKFYMTKLVNSLRESQRKEVLYTIRYTAEEKDHAPARYIGVLNGVYDIKQQRFINHSPDLVFTGLINAKYNPAAKCKYIDEMFETISGGDNEIVELIKEMIGYTIYRENLLEKSFILKGNGGNGKSTLLKMIAAFLGEENITSLSLSQLDEKFNTGLLKGKLANIGDDISYTTIKDTSVFKKLSTGEYVTAEFKHQDPFQFRSYAKLIFSANRIPRMNDSSLGLADRFIIIPMNARIRGTKKQDHQFENRITTEEARSYLLNIAIESLTKLLHRGAFTIPQIVQEELKDFNIANDPIKEWLGECEENGTDINMMPVQEAFNNYKLFCKNNGYKHPLSKKKLTMELKNYGYLSQRATVAGKQIRVYVSKR